MIVYMLSDLKFEKEKYMHNSKTKHEKRWGERDDLTGEHTFGDTGQILFAFLFFGVWITDSFFLNYTTQLNQQISLWIRIPLGMVILGFSGYCAWSGLRIVFDEVRETPSVIRKGIFGVIRHPVYLSEVLLYWGFFILGMSLASFAVLFCAMIFLYFLSRYEEKLLLKRFGKEYQEYIQDVGMWIPRLKKR